MLILVFVVSIIFIIAGNIVHNKCSGTFKGFGSDICILCSIIVTLTAIGIIFCGIQLSERMIIDDKISLFMEENTKIEQQIFDIVEGYKEYESGVFRDVSESVDPAVVVSLYPELKSDELVKPQIELYISNNAAIKELQLDKLRLKPIAWWLYFGE